MGIRGELFSTRITCEGRTYFFNVKENRMGDLFLTIVESKPTEAENFDRRSVVVFRDDVPQFLKAFQGALDFMAGGEGKAAKLPSYAASATAPAAKPRARKAPAGFAGAGFAGAAADPAAPARKRKVVVRRKPNESPETGAKD